MAIIDKSPTVIPPMPAPVAKPSYTKELYRLSIIPKEWTNSYFSFLLVDSQYCNYDGSLTQWLSVIFGAYRSNGLKTSITLATLGC